MKLPIVLILAAGALVAQTPATQSPNVARPSKGTDGAARRQDMVQRLTCSSASHARSAESSESNLWSVARTGQSPKGENA